MKYLLLVFALTQISQISYCQELIEIPIALNSMDREDDDVYYYAQPELSKFDGTWAYSNSGETFLIVLKSIKTYVRQVDKYMDFIQGYHIYASANQNQNFADTIPNITYGSFSERRLSFNKIDFLFSDYKNKLPGIAYLELLPGKSDQAHFKLVGKEHGNEENSTKGFSIPTDLILTKVK
jgi:hypothetical protein